MISVWGGGLPTEIGCLQTTLMDMIATVKTLPFTGAVSVNGHTIIDHGNVAQK